jgi:hypothetical protein
MAKDDVTHSVAKLRRMIRSALGRRDHDSADVLMRACSTSGSRDARWGV